MTSIGDYAFYGCSSLTSVVIPNGVTFIGRFAFAYCFRLTSINIPQGVTTIDDYAFQGCSGLSSVTIPQSVTTIGNYAFHGCSGLSSVTIPQGVTTIGSYAFVDCSGLSSLSIPSSVTSIGGFAFEGTPWYDNQHNGLVYAGKVAYRYKGEMPNGTQITIKDGTLSIAGYAFYDCGGLTSITIPKGVTNIGDYAFSGCNGLKEIYCYAEETPEISYYSFYNVDVSRVMLVVPDDVADKYKAHPIWRRFRIETPTGIPSIEDGRSKTEDGSIYNLSGQRLSKPIKGINVLNGKKVAIK